MFTKSYNYAIVEAYSCMTAAVLGPPFVRKKIEEYQCTHI